jgi:hypothetical protein
MGRRKIHAGFWRGDLKEKDSLEDLDVSEDNIKRDLRKTVGRGETGLIWFQMELSGVFI